MNGSGENGRPLGVVPEGFWRSQRIKELARAIAEYEASDEPVNPKWAEELLRHVVSERAEEE